MDRQPIKQERKMAFFEIGAGTLARDMQFEFEKAQAIAKELNGVVEVSLKIKVAPPDSIYGKFSMVEFSVSRKDPPKKSPVFTTRLVDGVIVQDGDSIGSVMQMDLFHDLGLELNNNYDITPATAAARKDGTENG